MRSTAPQGQEALIALASDPDPAVRGAVAFALATLAGTEPVDAALVRLLCDPDDTYPAECAAHALAANGVAGWRVLCTSAPPQDADAHHLLEHRWVGLREALLPSWLTRREARAQLVALAADPDDAVARPAAELLSDLEAEGLLDELG